MPEYAIPLLYLASLTFMHAPEIYGKIKNVPINIAIAQCLIICGGIFIIYATKDMTGYSKTMTTLLGSLCGLSVLILILSINFQKVWWIVGFISSVSFEIYLVHHNFCQGYYSVFSLNLSYFESLLLLLVISISLSFCLKKMSVLILRVIKK